MGKVSSISTVSVIKAGDKLLLTVTPFGVNSSRGVEIEDFFGDIPVPASFSNTASFVTANVNVLTANTLTATTFTVTDLTVSSNGIVISEQFTPSNSTITEMGIGKISYDASYIYVKVANNTIKRVALSSF